jgi:hypothetical protein
MNFSVEKDLGRSMGNPRALTVSKIFSWEGWRIPIPDKLRQDSESAGYAEEDGVEVHFYEAVVMQQDTRVSIDVRVRILDFAEFGEDTGGESIHLRHEFEQFVVGEVFQCEFPTSSVTIEQAGRYR